MTTKDRIYVRNLGNFSRLVFVPKNIAIDLSNPKKEFVR